MYLDFFLPKTKHNCGCISQVCIYKGIFRFWSALCGLLGNKCSIASSDKINTVHMTFCNSLRGARQLLRETNKPSIGAIQIQTLGKVTENLLLGNHFSLQCDSHNIAFNGIQSENFVDKTCAITRNIRQANHILALYMIIELLKNKFILKSTNYFETNNASIKIVPRRDYKKGYSYHVSNHPGKISDGI